MVYDFTIVIEPDDVGFHAFVPALSGCHSHGETLDEARANIAEAIELHVESLIGDGEDVPVERFSIFRLAFVDTGYSMTERLPVLTGHELVRVLEKAGFLHGRQKGSHLHMFRESDHRRVTVPIHKGRDLPPGTLRGILKDADISVDELRNLL